MLQKILFWLLILDNNEVFFYGFRSSAVSGMAVGEMSTSINT